MKDQGFLAGIPPILAASSGKKRLGYRTRRWRQSDLGVRTFRRWALTSATAVGHLPRASAPYLFLQEAARRIAKEEQDAPAFHFLYTTPWALHCIAVEDYGFDAARF